MPSTLFYLESIAAPFPHEPFDYSWTLGQIIEEEVSRLVDSYLVASVAARYRHWERTPGKPFRVRQLDVRWSRRIMYVYRNILRQTYGVQVPMVGLDPSPTQERRGATVDWLQWWGYHRPFLRRRAASVARWAISMREDYESRQVVMAMENEHDHILFSFRGLDGLSRELSRLRPYNPKGWRDQDLKKTELVLKTYG